MRGVSRRRLLGAAGLAGTAVAVSPSMPARAADTKVPAVTVRAGDVRYPDLSRGTNLRFAGNPEYVRLVTSTQQVVAAVQEAVASGRRFAVRSGGHCYENFVANPEIRIVIDLSLMSAVTFDAARNAFAVEAGANLEQVYKALFRGWGVSLPGGSCPSVGVGGHIAGGGYGPLSRRFGLTVDHLYAVEVVTVDAAGAVRAVVATREPDDPRRDLWWAHTGGGGGNFGVVTRYWFRSPAATGTDPAQLLPRPPSEVIVADLIWSWDGLTQAGFTALLRNFGTWLERNSAPGSPYAGLFSQLKPQHRVAGQFNLTTQIDASVSGADRLLDEFLAAVSAGVGQTPFVLERRRLPFLHAFEWPGFTGGRNPTWRFKIKSAYLRRSFTDAQIGAIHHHLTRTDYQHPGALMLITSYGGAVNAVPSDATAVPQRDSILKPQFLASWTDPADDARHLAWVRELYRDVFAATGGVPVPGAQTDGAYINYADVDLADPALNPSGVPWHELYYKSGYRRLQQVKARWDPADRFRHALSVRPPG
jgi:FAD/FMN-containing dehydrogenase